MPRDPRASVDLNGPVSSNDSDEVRAARAFVDGRSPAPPPSLPGELLDAVVAALVARGEGERLGALSSSSDKAWAKAARRGIHLLRARGVRASVPPPEPKRFLEPRAETALPSLVSPWVMGGERLLFFVQPDPVEPSQLELLQARLDEEEGLREVEVYRSTRKQWREMERQIREESGLGVTNVPPGYARWVLEEAYRRAEAKSLPTARRFAEVRATLPAPERPSSSAARALVSDGALAVARAAGHPERVLALPEVRTWHPDFAAVKKVMEAQEASAESPLVLDERTRRARAEEILERQLAEEMAGPWRARIEQRLRDTAEFLAYRAADRPEPARDYAADAALCLFAAETLAEGAPGVESNAVARAIFRRLIQEPSESTEATGEGGASTQALEPRSPSGLILP